MNQQAIDEETQADIPAPLEEDEAVKIRPLQRVRLYPCYPPEESSYGKKHFTRAWILQDGRDDPVKGSEMKAKYKTPAKPPHVEGIKARMLRDYFWEQMLEEVMEELAATDPVAEYCSEYNANFVKDQFEPRNLEITDDKTKHLLYPLYGTGSTPTTFYSETIKKTGPGEILEKFRRSQDFTKPMGERLDDGWVL